MRKVIIGLFLCVVLLVSLASVDASAGGICLQTDRELSVGVEAEMELFLPVKPESRTYRRIVAIGRAVREVPAEEGRQGVYQYGIEFTHIDGDMLQDLFDYVAKRESKG